MDDRADEVIAAIEMLKQRNDIATHQIGLIGYSQGGWVLPLVAKKSDYPDFMILVSGAINWLDQGDYLTKNRLKRKGFPERKIQQALVCNQHELQVLQPTSTYEKFLQYHQAASPECKEVAGTLMSRERFEFVKLNWLSDAREGLATVQVPTLGVFGDKDLNVDFAQSIREYKRIFNELGNSDLTTKIYPGAQHSLFQNRYIDDLRPGALAVIKMELLGDDIFAEGYLDFVAQWTSKITEQLHRNTDNNGEKHDTYKR
jgi:dienelactone hydrolase